MPPQDPLSPPTNGYSRPPLDENSIDIKYTPLQELDPYEPVPRPSVYRRESFIVQFAKTKGPPQIALLMMLVALGLGCTIGVVPAVMSDRFARLHHGYNGDACASFVMHDKPSECLQGSSDAQNTAALSSLISNSLTFVTSSLIGSLSDEHGRRAILIVGLFLSTLSPLCLFVMQLVPTMSPYWYYSAGASTGLVNWVAVALSSLADVLPQKWRAPGIGLLLSGFMLGFSFSPLFALFLNHLQLTFVSVIVVNGGFWATVFFLPETLPPGIAEEARRRRSEDVVHPNLIEHLGWIIARPVREMAILNRNKFFRLISLLAFFSGMVSSGDQTLLVYYVEERIGFTDKDVSIMYLIMGIAGLFAQAVLLKPLNDLVGEKMVVAICFFVGAVDNVMYGIAKDKLTIFAAIGLSALTGMAFPTISAIKANNVHESEQGRIQGALYSLQALASGIGPVFLRFIYHNTKHSVFGPGSMFVFAGMLYLVAVAFACALPKDQANSKRDEGPPGGILDDISFSSSGSYGSV